MLQWVHPNKHCIFCNFRSLRYFTQTARHDAQTGSALKISKQYGRTKHQYRDPERDGFVGTFHERRIRGRQSLYERLNERAKRRSRETGTITLKFGSREPEVELTVEERANKVIDRLENVRFVMERKKVTDDSEFNQMQELDPDGSRWTSFVMQIKQLVETSQKDKTKEEIDLWHKLLSAQKINKSVLDRELYFAFLDYVLDKSSSLKVKGIAGLSADLRYPTEWYSTARAQQRQIHLHVGPTNSGKTYNALKKLQESANGFYAGPLRLLAHEVYSRFRANGVPCDLVTGDDVRFDDNPNTKVYASTVEMVDTSREVEVAVIDEIQMMSSEERGWAWTRAFLGANARQVHLCGESRVIPLVRELAASMGDTLQIHQYERLNPLKATSQSLRGNLKKLRKGDCVVSFTVVGIHALKRQIELDTGRRCAIVYGSLPPETRANQAELFNDPDNDYDFLVASDAIGMGLNLSIKRIVFESLTKHNGLTKEQLSVPQIKQIAGRAGRFRTAHDDKTKQHNPDDQKELPLSIGLVTCLDEMDLSRIHEALNSEPPPLRTAGILPPAEYIEDFATRLPASVPFEYVLQRICDAAKVHPRFGLCSIRDNLTLARSIEDISGLSTVQRVNITAAPASSRDPGVIVVLRAFARVIAEQKNVTVADVTEIPLEVLEEPLSHTREYLASLEVLHKSLILFLWLSYRFTTNFGDRPMAIHAKELCEEKINRTLKEFSANPKLRQRLLKIRQEQENLTIKPVAEAEQISSTIVDWSEHPSLEEIASEEERSEVDKASMECNNGADLVDAQFPQPGGIDDARLANDGLPYNTKTIHHGGRESQEQEPSQAAASG